MEQVQRVEPRQFGFWATVGGLINMVGLSVFRGTIVIDNTTASAVDVSSLLNEEIGHICAKRRHERSDEFIKLTTPTTKSLADNTAADL